MIGKKRISEIRKLHQKKFRDELKLFLVEGKKSVQVLCESDFEILQIYVTPDALKQNKLWLENQNIVEISNSEMERVSTMQTPPEIFAVAYQKTQLFPILENEPIIALDKISDPGNLGTIIRTADWFGFRHIVCSNDCVEFYNPKTIQATMGSFANVSVLKTNLNEFLQKESKKRRIIGTFMNGKNIKDFKFRNNDILILGNEANGISKETADICTEKLTINKFSNNTSKVESLNVGISGAIVMYCWSAC